jgi:transposase
MPKNHQAQVEWTPERITSWAKQSGNAVGQLVETMMRLAQHPQQAFRPCVGIIRLGKSYGTARLEAAAKRALHIGVHSYKSVESILKNNLDQRPLPPDPSKGGEQAIPESHEYIRGKDYFS